MWSISTLNTVEFEKNDENFIKKSKLCIYNAKSQPGLFLRCFYFLAKFEPRCSYEIVLIKKACIILVQRGS